MVAALGIPTYGIRACARIRDDKDKLNKNSTRASIIHMSATKFSINVLFYLVVFIKIVIYNTFKGDCL